MSPYHFVTYLLLWHQRDRNVTIFPAQNCLLFTPQVASGSSSSSSLYGKDTLKCSATPVVGMIPAEALTWAQWKRERERERESRSYYNFFYTNTSWLEVFFYTSVLHFLSLFLKFFSLLCILYNFTTSIFMFPHSFIAANHCIETGHVSFWIIYIQLCYSMHLAYFSGFPFITALLLFSPDYLFSWYTLAQYTAIDSLASKHTKHVVKLIC